MKLILPLSLAVTVALAACKPAEPPAPAAPDSTAAAAATPTTPTTPTTATAETPTDTPPATASEIPNVEPSPVTDPAQQASLSGYGDMKLGSSVEEAKKGWGGDLKALGKETDACHYLVPMWAKDGKALAFMIEEGKFVRYESSSAKEVAPGGGKVGMGVDALKTLYPNLQSTPHKYVEGGQYLSTTTSGASPTKLVFEVDPTGKVTQWRVGLLPQADYVEGCS